MKAYFWKPGTGYQAVCVAVVVAGLVWLVLWLLYPPATPSECGASLANLKDSLVRAIREEVERKDANSHLPIIYVITPTYRRPEQMPELTRLAQTLMNVPRVHWLVAEDAQTTNTRVTYYLLQTGLSHTYLLTPMPAEHRNKTVRPKGVANRNGGLAWVREQAREGVVYFADDDNTYDIRLFEEMRHTRKVSMWPVGLISGSGVSSPILRNGRFVGWYDGWIGGRTFPVDMAGFAVGVEYLLERPDAQMPFTPGHEEDGFLRSLGVKPSEIEFKAAECTQIYVWHTQTKKNHPYSREILSPRFDKTNLRVLQKDIMLQPG
ncbi:galactosylgalactosylxylosylprotein 3-beta-glucuronosyltransferase P-like [Eriocheir sinensis]|uniref:galactosylgalactosylxylosylprotein 3-beta-glucuronosyltransferase P-like n=1 Tax=Eriocheir sinensis TaxID=95602 RepID=UPI0021CA8E26|nr:galactosylgalactosylxylosylprotein 3-beta-glucuronosyltransferase P-like [Eriocheir sinensis]XP_050713639.1 galactosylgalactosylxylosylprotein 3-beta-glucuronosyltransferase P-like [Eriocheir sinensis]XP_050713640.1 galactosylgalactosylxylosylprotein 3-beta-glucuronosyltransferase P-like [Eriocheir sinensis]